MQGLCRRIHQDCKKHYIGPDGQQFGDVYDNGDQFCEAMGFVVDTANHALQNVPYAGTCHDFKVPIWPIIVVVPGRAR